MTTARYASRTIAWISALCIRSAIRPLQGREQRLQPRADIGRHVQLGGGHEPAQLGQELDLTAAPPACLDMLEDPQPVRPAEVVLQVVPQLPDRLGATDHAGPPCVAVGCLSRSCWTAYVHSCFSNSFRPRCSRASRVPSGRPSIRAACLVATSCMCTNTSGTRYISGISRST